MNDITIRSINEFPDVKQVENVQIETWGIPERDVIPARLLHALQHNGACLIGAFDGSDLIGFVFGSLGTVENLKDRIDQVAAARLQMYSVTMGVLPSYQHRGLGFRLKLAQREFAIRIGVRLITWTYDPLESRNGYFNIRKLGAISHRYFRDFHGPMSGINLGLPSDRFYVDWWVTSNRVQSRVSSSRGPLNLEAYTSGGAIIINEAIRERGKLPQPQKEYIYTDTRIALVEIPVNFQKIKREDMDLAIAWRLHLRDLAESHFKSGYVVTDFVRHESDDGTFRSFYVLTKSDEEAAGPRA